MKRNPISALLLSVSATASWAFSVDKIDPPHWWAGMHDPSVQIQIHGNDVRACEVDVKHPGVTLDSVARLDQSPNWLYIYLNISPEAKPGNVEITLRDGKMKKTVKYPILERRQNRGAQGFDASDVLYMVMPDRFSDGDPSNNVIETMNNPAHVDRTNLNVRHGGDLRGIINHIDYLDSLGITALWLNPVLENDQKGGSYHGYATTDYYSVDRRFGSNSEYAELIAKLHDRNIKTVMDMIFNHCGSDHPWRIDPPASDWFNFQDNYIQTNYRLSTIADPYASSYDKALTTDGWFVKGMPDLNQNNPHLMKYLTQNSIWWIEEAGIDGIRMDTYPYADMQAMARWIDDVKAEYPHFNIVGECWFTDVAGEASWQKGSKLPPNGIDSNLPTVMDFGLMVKMRDMAPLREQTDPWNGLNRIYDHLSLDYAYPDPMSVLRFLDNHDTERFILTEPDSLSQWKQAITLLLTIPGIPQVYYGTELLMSGDRKKGDGNVRRDMPGGFPGDTATVFTREGRSDIQNEAIDFMRTILNWRKSSAAIGKGDMLHFMPTNGLYLYRRSHAGDEVIVVMNGTDRSLDADMSRYTEITDPGQTFTDILTGETITLIPSDNMHRVFAPREVRILQKK